MANEVINRKEKVILVQVNTDIKTESVLTKNPYGSGYNAFSSLEQATDFGDVEKAKKIASALNTLYELSGDNFEVRVAREVTERKYVDEPTTVNNDTV